METMPLQEEFLTVLKRRGHPLPPGAGGLVEQYQVSQRPERRGEHSPEPLSWFSREGMAGSGRASSSKLRMGQFESFQLAQAFSCQVPSPGMT